MRTKWAKRALALLLATFMVIGGIPFTNYEPKAVLAAGNTHVFEASTMATVSEKGTFTDGQEVKYDDYFTIYMSASSRVDSSSKTWDDGYTSGQRLNLGGKADVSTPKNVMSFKTSGAATVKIWWVEGGEDHRELGIFTADGKQVAVTTEGAGAAKNGVVITNIVFNTTGGERYCVAPAANSGTATADASSSTITWNGEVEGTLELAADNGQIRFTTMTVTYTAGSTEAPAVPAPATVHGTKTTIGDLEYDAQQQTLRNGEHFEFLIYGFGWLYGR